MYYPDHHIRTYCRYLGSVLINDSKYDLGVYMNPDGSVSHAIVYGNDDGDYLSGDVTRTWTTITRINLMVFKENMLLD